MKIEIERQVMQMALNALECTQSEPGSLEFEIQEEAMDALREALAMPQSSRDTLEWPVGSTHFHADLLNMGKSMAKQRSREIGDAWNQLADLLSLLAKARTESAHGITKGT